MNHHVTLRGYGTGLVWVLVVGALNWVVVAVRMLASLAKGRAVGSGALDIFSLLGDGPVVFWTQLLTYVAIGVVAVFVVVFWASDLLCDTCDCSTYRDTAVLGNPNKKHAHQIRLTRRRRS